MSAGRRSMSGHNFNPLPPCGGRRRRCGRLCQRPQFQSTPSVWRETAFDSCRRQIYRHFNPLPPCGGRQHGGRYRRTIKYFNPLPPCGGRRRVSPPVRRSINFNPLPPCGGRHDGVPVWLVAPPEISIHSLRVEGDLTAVQRWREQIISIHSLRVEGDIPAYRRGHRRAISIHSLRVEGDHAARVC